MHHRVAHPSYPRSNRCLPRPVSLDLPSASSTIWSKRESSILHRFPLHRPAYFPPPRPRVRRVLGSSGPSPRSPNALHWATCHPSISLTMASPCSWDDQAIRPTINCLATVTSHAFTCALHIPLPTLRVQPARSRWNAWDGTARPCTAAGRSLISRRANASCLTSRKLRSW